MTGCPRHPGAPRYASSHQATGACSECQKDYGRAVWYRKRPASLARLAGDEALAAALAARLSNSDLGLVVLALRAAVRAGRAAERRKIEWMRAYQRASPRQDMARHLNYRVRKYGDSPPSAAKLGELHELRETVRAAESAMAAQLRAAGYSDARIAAELPGEITKQGVAKRYPRQPKVAPALENAPPPAGNHA